MTATQNMKKSIRDPPTASSQIQTPDRGGLITFKQ